MTTPQQPDLRAASIEFVGTATTLIEAAGFTILTDPNFLHKGEHVHLGYGLKSRRLTEPSIQPEDLPSLDFVVLSHLHEDHFDRVAEERLDEFLPILTTPHASARLDRKGFRDTRPLRTWQDVSFRNGPAQVRVTSLPGRHGPRGVHRLLPPVMGSLLDFEIRDQRVLRLYISGDTLVFRDLEEIPRRFPDIDLALLHLGGTRVAGILVTMDGRQGVEAMKVVRPRSVIPIHFDDYTVFKSPLSDFRARVKAAGLSERVRYLQRGERHEFRVAEPPEPGPPEPARAWQSP